jgi:hypothetical protein
LGIAYIIAAPFALVNSILHGGPITYYIEKKKTLKHLKSFVYKCKQLIGSENIEYKEELYVNKFGNIYKKHIRFTVWGGFRYVMKFTGTINDDRQVKSLSDVPCEVKSGKYVYQASKPGRSLDKVDLIPYTYQEGDEKYKKGDVEILKKKEAELSDEESEKEKREMSENQVGGMKKRNHSKKIKRIKKRKTKKYGRKKIYTKRRKIIRPKKNKKTKKDEKCKYERQSL